MSEIHVNGLAQLQKFLDALPQKVEQNILRGALRAAANVVKAEAVANVPVDSGTLKAGLKVSTRSRRGLITASVKATGKHAHIAPWIEFGTRAHKIHAKDAKTLSLRPNSRASSGYASRWTAHNFLEFVEHPGTKPRPFMRPALDSQAGNAVVAAGNYIKKRLATKHGLDTSDIVIGEDE